MTFVTIDATAMVTVVVITKKEPLCDAPTSSSVVNGVTLIVVGFGRVFGGITRVQESSGHWDVADL